MQKALAQIPKKQSPIEMIKEIDKNHDKLKLLYYGLSNSVDKAFVHINDMLDVAAKDREHIRQDYASLCDYVHPNYGSNTLVSGGTLGAGLLYVNSKTFLETKQITERIVEETAIVSEECNMEIGKKLIELSSWIGIASQSNAKPSQIFSERSGVVGDGKSRDTALFFTKARNHFEAMQALHTFLEKEGYTKIGNKIKGVEAGYLFDIILTDRGSLWSKFKFQSVT